MLILYNIVACLKAHNHVFGQFLNMSIYITNKTYILPINLTNFEPLKPSRYISLLVFKISKEAVKQPCLDQKIQCLFSKYSYLCVYFDIKFPGLSPIYPNVTLKLAKIGCYVPLSSMFL